MMQKTAADFIKLAQDHPFCASFLITARQLGQSEEEMQAGLLKAAAASPIRAAEIDRFLEAAGVSSQVKMAAGWAAKLQKLQSSMNPAGLGNQVQKMRNWVSSQDPASKALLAGGAAATATAAGLGGAAYMHRPDGPQPAGSRQLAPPQVTDDVSPPQNAAPPAVKSPVKTPVKTPAAPPVAKAPVKAPPVPPFRTTQSTAPLAEPKIPASIGGHSYGDKATPSPAGPAWYTNPAVLGGGGLLALALLARNMGGPSQSEEDDEQDY